MSITDVVKSRKVQIFFHTRVDIGWHKLTKTGDPVACSMNVDAAVGLNVDRRAGWEQTEHGPLTQLTLFAGGVM